MALRRHMFAGERFGQRGRQRSQTLLRALNLLLPSRVLRLCFLQYFVDIFFWRFPPFCSSFIPLPPPSSHFFASAPSCLLNHLKPRASSHSLPPISPFICLPFFLSNPSVSQSINIRVLAGGPSPTVSILTHLC